MAELDVLRLSVRSRNCLIRAGIFTVEQVAERPADELLAIPGFGVGCLREVRGELARLHASSDGRSLASAAEVDDLPHPDQLVVDLLPQLGVDVRSCEALAAHGVTTIAALTKLGPEQLLEIPGFDHRS